jgi:hypothetical protein
MGRAFFRHSILPVTPIARGPAGLGRAEPHRLRPAASDIDLFGYGKGVVNLDAKISNCTFNFSVSKQ